MKVERLYRREEIPGPLNGPQKLGTTHVVQYHPLDVVFTHQHDGSLWLATTVGVLVGNLCGFILHTFVAALWL